MGDSAAVSAVPALSGIRSIAIASGADRKSSTADCRRESCSEPHLRYQKMCFKAEISSEIRRRSSSESRGKQASPPLQALHSEAAPLVCRRRLLFRLVKEGSQALLLSFCSGAATAAGSVQAAPAPRPPPAQSGGQPSNLKSIAAGNR